MRSPESIGPARLSAMSEIVKRTARNVVAAALAASVAFGVNTPAATGSATSVTVTGPAIMAGATKTTTART